MITTRARCLVLSMICLLTCFPAIVVQADSPPRIRSVSIDPPFFHPGARQFSTITFYAGVAGTATVTILDRDRYPVRTLGSRFVGRGLASFTWDGRDDSGTIVPDEAWNIRIELAG